MHLITESKTNQFIVLVILAVFVALPYSNTLHSPFTFDDAPNITKNRHLQLADLSLSSLSKAATKSMNKRRWLPNISFALNNYFSRDDVFSYHLVNITLHTITSLFLYGLLACTLSLPWSGLNLNRAREISFLAALLWGVHPVNTSAVTYIVQRMTIMAALFYVASLFFYLRGRTYSGPLINRLPWYLACLATALFAFASKENSFMLPFAVVGFELYFLRQDRNKETFSIIIAALVALVFIAVSAWNIFDQNIVEAILGGYKNRDFTLSERLLTESRVVFHYLSLLGIPFPHRFNLAYDYQLSTGLFSPPQTFIAVIGLLSLAFSLVYLFKKHRLWSFALFWFFLNLIIESTVIPLELIFEHRLYLPSMFIFVAFIVTLSSISFPRTKLFRGIVLIFAILLTIFTWQRNKVWSSEISLWEDVAKKSPQLVRAHLNVGFAYSNEGNYQESIKHYLKAISLKPESKDAAKAWLNLANSYGYMGQYQKSEEVLKKILNMTTPPQLHMVHSNLAYIYIKKGEYDKAVDEAKTATQINPGYVNGYMNLGMALIYQGQHDMAESTLRHGLILAPRDSRLLMLLADALEKQYKYQEAIMTLNQARNMLTPGDPNWSRINSKLVEMRDKVSK